MAEEEKKTKKDYSKILNFIIFGFAFLAIIFGLYFAYIFNNRFYPLLLSGKNYSDNLGSLGAILSGTTGIWISAASIILFLLSLRLTRLDLKLQGDAIKQTEAALNMQRDELINSIVEAKKANEIYEKQQKVMMEQVSTSILFNLIQNHKQLVAELMFKTNGGQSGLMFACNNTKEGLDTYQKHFSNNFFPASVETSNNAIYFFKEYPTLMEVVTNILHIVEFIKTKLNNDIFYHSTFYNNLNSSEKFLFGMALQNEFVTFNSETNFDYLIYYRENCQYGSFKDNFFPTITFSRAISVPFRLLKGASIEMLKNIYKINFHFNFLNIKEFEKIPLELESYDFIFEFEILSTRNHIKENYKVGKVIDVLNGISIDFYQPLFEFNFLSNPEEIHSVNLNAYNFQPIIILNFKYRNKKIKLQVNLQVTIIKDRNGDRQFNYSVVK